MEKVEEKEKKENDEKTCFICLETNVKLESFSSCNHLLHRVCVEKFVSPVCPLCRIKLNHAPPDLEDSLWTFFRSDRLFSHERIVTQSRTRTRMEHGNISNWSEEGYLSRDEHPDYDSQNPDSDLDYPDEDEDDEEQKNEDVISQNEEESEDEEENYRAIYENQSNSALY